MVVHTLNLFPNTTLSCQAPFEDHFPYSSFHPSPSQKDYDVFKSIKDDVPPLLCPSNLATLPSPTLPLSTSHHVEPIVSSSSTSSEAPSSSSTTTSVMAPIVVAPTQDGPTSIHPMTTRSKIGSLKQREILNLSATTGPCPIMISTAQALCDPN
nr:hypothetical protein [Tanacetum cinerariifolium]